MEDYTANSASPSGREGSQAKKMRINDQMLSKKHMLRVKDEVSKIKVVVTDMNIKVNEHHHQIKSNIVDDEKLRITVELLESALDQRMQQAIDKIENKLVPKIKKRFKMKELNKLLE